MNRRQYQIWVYILAAAALVGIYMSRSFYLLILSYVLICMLLMFRSISTAVTLWKKLYYVVRYVAIMVLQIVFTTVLTFRMESSVDSSGFTFAFLMLISTLAIPMPIVFEDFFSMHDNKIPSAQDMRSISYAQYIDERERIREAQANAERAGNAFSRENLTKLFEEMHGHSSFHYVNNGSLTEAYFEDAATSLDDEGIYIVLTDTGSPASEIIGVFTHQRFNHVSLSFDAELRTTISYNGGNNVYPPGMNPEMVAWFHKKEDSAVLIYRLKAPRAQKQMILDKVREINEQGSAYNLLGLVFKYSIKPNIMYCSQFVNKMLECAGLDYLDKRSADVRPSDFVELDYRRRLEFVREITF